jgi:GTP-binding protein
VSSASGRDPIEDFEFITRELALFGGAGEDDAGGVRLADKPCIAAANKIDALDDPTRLKKLTTYLKRKKIPVVPISAVSGEGVPALLELMWRAVAAEGGRAGA